MIFLVGCSQEAEQDIYVPGTDFFQSLDLSVSTNKPRVNEPAIITVIRRADGWVKAKEGIESECLFNGSPPPVEDDASLNSLYIVEPSNGYEFSLNENGERTLMFTKPGNYKVVARSALWCSPGILSKPVFVEVIASN